MITKNIGPQGRIVRLLIAIVLLIYSYCNQSLLGAFLGLFTLFEVAMSWCVIRHLLGKNSCPIDSHRKNKP